MKTQTVGSHKATVRQEGDFISVVYHNTEVVNVTHGRDFLPNVREEKPDIVLLDVFLTNMDGKELVAEVRKSQDFSDLKVVMTSGMDLAEQCAKAGADAFLLKPYTPEQLMKVLQDNLENIEGNMMPSATHGES